MNNANELKGFLFVALSGFFYGFVGYFGFRALESSPDPANMLFWRFLVATAVIALAIIPQLRKITYHLPSMLGTFSAGALFYGASTLAYFSALHYIDTGVAMVIFFVYPAIVILCNWLLYRHRISTDYFIAIALILIGLICLIEIKLGFNYQGLVLSLISGLAYALYIVASKRNNTLHPLLSSWLVSAGCAIMALILALYQGTFFLPRDLHFWLNTLGLGIFSTAVPILLLFQGLKYIGSNKAAILGVLEPVFVVITGVLLLGEALRVVQVFGMIVLLSGAVLALVSGNERVRSFFRRGR